MVSIDSWWDSRVRDRSQALLELVINAIADDYESVDIILKSINEWGDCGPKPWPALAAIPVSRYEVIVALRELIREGYAQAFIFRDGNRSAAPVGFIAEETGDLWFYVTPRGIHAVQQMSGQIYGDD